MTLRSLRITATIPFIAALCAMPAFAGGQATAVTAGSGLFLVY